MRILSKHIGLETCTDNIVLAQLNESTFWKHPIALLGGNLREEKIVGFARTLLEQSNNSVTVVEAQSKLSSPFWSQPYCRTP
jgi:hypothetical protein